VSKFQKPARNIRFYITNEGYTLNSSYGTMFENYEKSSVKCKLVWNYVDEPSDIQTDARLPEYSKA
jgi:hypothetical protein